MPFFVGKLCWLPAPIPVCLRVSCDFFHICRNRQGNCPCSCSWFQLLHLPLIFCRISGGARVFIGCRDTEKCETTIADLNKSLGKRNIWIFIVNLPTQVLRSRLICYRQSLILAASPRSRRSPPISTNVARASTFWSATLV